MAGSPKLCPPPPMDGLAPAAAPPVPAGEEEFARLLVGCQERLSRLVHRLLGWSAAEAEDLVQEVLLAAMAHRQSFRGEAALATWLARIAVNRVRSHQRGVGRRLRLWLGLADRRREVLAPPPEAGLEDRETLAEVRRAVRELPAKAREVVVLHYLEGLPLAATAAVLGTTRGAVEVRLHRARRRLQGRLGPYLEEK